MLFTTSVVLVLASAAVDARACPPLGAVLPPPQDLAGSEMIAQASGAAIAALEEQFASLDSSGVSVAMKSMHDDALLLNFHHTPSEYSGNGAKTIDETTIYRIASATKVFTVLAVLQQCNIRMDDPITKYIPELKEIDADVTVAPEIDSVRWEQVTIGAVASHMSGIGADLALDLALFPDGPWTELGLPPVNGNGPSCSGLPGTPPCTPEDFFREIGRRHPVFAPFTNPVYSNIGSFLLQLVVESATNSTLGGIIQERIFDVADMSSSSFGVAPEVEEAGFIPTGDVVYGRDMGIFTSAGGIYSNIVDMLKFGEAILSNKFLSPAQTRKWLKPLASTAGRGFQMGAPWEIMRSTNITSDGRLIEVYTKSGDLGSYHSMLVLVPDYDVVVTVLSAGSDIGNYFASIVVSNVLRNMLPAVEEVGKSQAEASFSGTYTDSSSNSSITLSLDNGPGIVLSDWIMKGVNVLNNLPMYSISPSAETVEESARLFPTNLSADRVSAWRAVFQQGSNEGREALESMLIFPDGICNTWGTMDRINYNFVGLDEFVFTTGEDGIAREIDARGFGIRMERAS